MSVQVQLRRDITTNVQANKGAVGEVFVDTTVNRLVVQDGATNGGWPTPLTLSVQNSGSTNNSNSGSGAFVNHTPTFTIPANFMTAARAFRVTIHFQMTTGSAPPNLNHRLVLGTSLLGLTTAFIPGASLTNVNFGLMWLFQATGAPSGSTKVQCLFLTAANGGAAAQISAVAQPVAVATNAAQAVTIGTQWSAAGTGTNTIALNQLIVEALN
jgi:Major tropism determinant N-terminal domain